MAHGYPDFFGQSIWPKYGGFQNIQGTVTQPFGTHANAIAFSGNGVLSSMNLVIACLADERDHFIRVDIDGFVLNELRVNEFIVAAASNYLHDYFDLDFYDPLTFVACFRMRTPIPFQVSFAIDCWNTNVSGNSVTFSAKGAYYQVQ